MATFHERLNLALGPHGYNVGLRRSLQSVVLFEAKRCVDEFEASRTAQHLPPLRSVQCKAILWKVAQAILASMYIQPRQREEILWRTRTSKEPLGDEIAWKRARMIEKDLSKLTDDIRPYQADGRSSDEAVDLYIQGLFVRIKVSIFRSFVAKQVSLTLFSFFEFPRKAATGPKEEPTDFLRWAYGHNNLILCYRMYYKNGVLDPSLPPARSPVPIQIPIGGNEWMEIGPPPAQSNFPAPAQLIIRAPAQSNMLVKASVAEKTPSKELGHANVAPLKAAAVAQDSELTTEKRRVVLNEVREHLELLKEFEGVVPEEELKKRKLALFFALPDAPPPFERSAKLFE
jgi:hypothetical protein